MVHQINRTLKTILPSLSLRTKVLMEEAITTRARRALRSVQEMQERQKDSNAVLTA
jgi:hypothetical protein